MACSLGYLGYVCLIIFYVVISIQGKELHPQAFYAMHIGFDVLGAFIATTICISFALHSFERILSSWWKPSSNKPEEASSKDNQPKAVPSKSHQEKSPENNPPQGHEDPLDNFMMEVQQE